MFLSNNRVTVINGHTPLSKNTVTIDTLFHWAKRASYQAERAHIQYHPQFAFVMHLDLDWNKQTYDDECQYEVVDFVDLSE